MKKLRLAVWLLAFLVLVLSSVSGCSSTPASTPIVHNFRDYKWGTPMSVVLGNEGDTPHKRDTTTSGVATYTIAYPVEDFSIQTAGHLCDMEMEFYNNALITGSYWFQLGRHGSEPRIDIYRDLSSKLTNLYGKPSLSNNGNRATWGNIQLIYLDTNLVWLYYVSVDFVLERSSQNTTGL